MSGQVSDNVDADITGPGDASLRALQFAPGSVGSAPVQRHSREFRRPSDLIAPGSQITPSTEQLPPVLRSRKLALILDVDHTMLHATMTKHIPFSLLSIMADLFFFKMSLDDDGTPIFCLVKLRPGLLTFLKNASKLFEIYLCTFGTATYAREVRHKLVELTSPSTLNPTLISREQLHHPDDKRYVKDLSQIIKLIGGDLDPSYCVLVDDRHDVWTEEAARSNLIRIHPYSFFLGQSQPSATTPPQQPSAQSSAPFLMASIAASKARQDKEAGPSAQSNSLRSAAGATLTPPGTPRLNRSTDSSSRHFTEVVPAANAIPEINLSTASVNDTCLQSTWSTLKYIYASFWSAFDAERSGPTLPLLSERLAQSHIKQSLQRRRHAVLDGSSVLYVGIAADMSPLGELFGAKTIDNSRILEATHVVSPRLEQQEMSRLVESLMQVARSAIAMGKFESGVAASQVSVPESLQQEADVDDQPRKKLFIVSYNWVRESLKNWRRAPESSFLLAAPLDWPPEPALPMS